MKDAKQWLQADLIDIVFDGRNKAYGAYELRRSYPRRLMTGLLMTTGVCAGAWLLAALQDDHQYSGQANWVVTDTITLTEFIPPKPPELKQPAPVQTVASTRFTKPLITDEVLPEEKIPENTSLDSTLIGVKTTAGTPDTGAVATTTGSATDGSGEKPVPAEEPEKLFTRVEIPAGFPGGPDAWRRYLERYLRYPESAQENGTQGMVKVQFIVDRDGNISNVIALNDPGDGLAAEAVRIISHGPKWIPAMQNNRHVNYRQIQSIYFRME